MKISLQERRKIFFATLFPMVMLAIIWIVKGIENFYDLDLGVYGILPRDSKGLIGVLFAPLIHGDLTHLINNSVPLLILGFALFYFYKPIAWKVIILSYFLTSIYTWISARYNYHIGASGLVYALFSFLLLSGFIRRHLQLIAISFLVAFLYGSLIWGVLPWDVKVSWEGHFWGFFVGVVLAFYFRKQGPQRKIYEWDEEDEEDDGDSEWNDMNVQEDYWKSNSSNQIGSFDYKIRKSDEKKDDL